MLIDDFLCDDTPENIVHPVSINYDKIPDEDEQIMLEMMQYNIQQQKSKFQRRTARKEVPIDKTLMTLDEIDILLDTYISNNFKSVPSFKSLLDQLKGIHIRRLKEMVNQSRGEISSVLTTKDEELIDAYSNLTKSEIKKIVVFYDNLISDCDNKIVFLKKLRKPRKKKEISVDKLLSSVQFCEGFKELNLKSLFPKEILGANSVWVYNTSYRKLGCYYASNQEGLSIKGTTIQNFNSSRSIQKTVRKPKEVLTKVLEGDRVVLNKIMDLIRTTENKLTGRLNKDTVILRVIL